ncbi:MAG: hypothetical protein ACRD3O_04160 [Terriglobia bacterium]
MENQQTRIDTRQKGEPRYGRGHEERMMFFFGIAIILLGVTAMIILHVRSALPGLTSEVASDARSLDDSTQQSIADEVQWLDQNLSPAQEVEVRPVVEEEVQQRIALLEMPSISTSEQTAQLVELRNHALEEIRPVLTERQRTKLRNLEQGEGAAPTEGSGD